MAQKIVCTSCKRDITNDSGTAMFPCPKCAKTRIVRCRHCRDIASKYVCSDCGFTGPN